LFFYDQHHSEGNVWDNLLNRTSYLLGILREIK
jgi:hypothetical protein